MNYTVVWLQSAEHELAELWLDASSDRDSITNASNSIDQLLRSNPESAGESRSSGRRILFVTPLGAVFRIVPNDRLVIVIRVWRSAKSR